MRLTIKLLFCLNLFFTGLPSAMSQLSGTINTYTKVTAVDYVCNSITVSSITGFAAGDKVLIIQMQGATIDQTSSAAYGDITAINDAGNFEFGIIDHFVGNAVYLTKTLLRTYTPSGSVQMISVPQYGAVSIDAELTAKAWDGNTGGVIILESSDVVTLNADINASEQGFRGGQKSLAGGDCNTSSTNIYTYPYPNINAGEKGEGISAYISGKESGRGKNATGGGGGNSHNTGGGGGANYGAGGRGGDKKNTGCTFSPDPYGYGSVGLGSTYYGAGPNRIFLGGGGGGGHQNNFLSYDAGNGGGIIIIKSVDINTNGYTIKSNGGSVSTYYTTSAGDNGDGNSGGGAGGTILLLLDNYATASATTEAYGGKGGNTGYTTYDFGPGGGGGGGVLWLTQPSTTIASKLMGGTAGISGSGGGQGSGTSWGAVNGTPGAVLTGVYVPQSLSNSSCALPVEILNFNAKANGKFHVELNWSTASELNNHFFTLEKSTDGIHFSAVATQQGQENSSQLTNYSYTDEVSTYDILYYRLSQTDLDGHTVSLGIRKVYPASEALIALTAYPNPCGDQLYLALNSSKKMVIKSIYFLNVLGETVAVDWKENDSVLALNTSLLREGLYSLVVQFEESIQVVKILKR